MMAMLAMLVVLLGAGWLVFVGLLSTAKPERSLHYLALMGSTWTINLAELGPRAVVGFSMVWHAPASKNPDLFTLIGWFLAISAVLILAVPRQRHHAFAREAAKRIPAWALRWLLGPISVAAGLFVAWAAF